MLWELQEPKYAAAMSATRLLLAPGGSGDPRQLARHVAGLRDRGIPTDLVTLPRGAAERAIPAYRSAVAPDATSTAIGGQSFGGRVASLLAAETRPAALVAFAYPLHAPGRHDAWVARTEHWPSIACPVLLLSGESDPFARVDLLRRAVDLLPNARLVTYPGVGHGVGPVIDAALDEVAEFLSANT